MDAHAHDHHAPDEPEAPTNAASGLGLGLAIVAIIVALVGAIRGSGPILGGGALLALVALFFGLGGLAMGVLGGRGSRGSGVTLALTATSLLLWLVTHNHT